MMLCLGLMFDDIRHETPELKEALRRLPPHVVDERTFRIDRALQLSSQKQVLPKEEWMTFEKVDSILLRSSNEISPETFRALIICYS